MRVRVDRVDRDEVVAANDRTLGYRGSFTSDLVSGEAVFLPYSGREQNLFSGAVLTVEVSQEAVSGFVIVSSDCIPCLTPLSSARDYAVVGTVSNITLTVEGAVMAIDVAVGGQLSFGVDAEGVSFSVVEGGCSFVLDPGETEGVIPKVRDMASFNVHGLTLWDANV